MKPMVNNSGVWKGTQIDEKKMTEDEKEKKEDIVKGMKKDKKGFKKRYGKDAKSVMYATATKLAMEEKHKDHEPEMIRSQLKTAKRASKKIKKHTLKKDNFKAWVQSKITKASDYLDTAADYLDSKDDVKEELNKKDKPFIKKLVKNLRKGSKTHAKQADKLEKAVNEESNPRIPRKKGQPANSKKHSDLYTDENPKGTIHGLGFKDVAKAKASVSKIRNSSRSHAHKIQAAVAMEQRAREMGKTSEAAVYRKYINSMKKKTKSIMPSTRPMTIKESVAVTELEDGLKNLKVITYDSVDQLMQGIAKRNGISETLLHNQFKAKHFQIPDDWAVRYRMNKRRGIEEEKMTPAEKRKDTMLKKKYDKSDMKKSMQKQYGKEEGKKVYFATIRKQAMQEAVPLIGVAADQTFNDGAATSAAIDHNKKLLGIGQYSQKKKPTVTKKVTICV
jgi:hypothetical protein